MNNLNTHYQANHSVPSANEQPNSQDVSQDAGSQSNTDINLKKIVTGNIQRAFGTAASRIKDHFDITCPHTKRSMGGIISNNSSRYREVENVGIASDNLRKKFEIVIAKSKLAGKAHSGSSLEFLAKLMDGYSRGKLQRRGLDHVMNKFKDNSSKPNIAFDQLRRKIVWTSFANAKLTTSDKQVNFGLELRLPKDFPSETSAKFEDNNGPYTYAIELSNSENAAFLNISVTRTDTNV